ncbi:Serine protease 48 [Plecturocebus cupreus]
MGPAGCAFTLLLLLGISVCRRPVYSSRIAGGQDAAAGRWPWQVSLHLDNNLICGGSLVSERWILIAAHCLPSAQNRNQNRISMDNKQQCLLSTQVMAETMENGRDSDYHSTVQEAEVPIIDHQACEQLFNSIGIFLPALEPVIKEDKICAGDTQNMKDSCKGDSGWPLSCHIDGIWIQIGVVSWGLECGKSLPRVYTIVIYYQKWINATISRANNLDFSDFLFPIVLLSLALLDLTLYRVGTVVEAVGCIQGWEENAWRFSPRGRDLTGKPLVTLDDFIYNLK